MAARAGDGEPEHALRHGVDLLVGEVHLELGAAARVVALGANGEIARRDQLFGALGVVARLHEVARDLLDKEAVVGLVLVEARDDIVAVAPRVRIEDVRLLAARFAVARDIEPVAAPALAELRARKHRVNRARERLGRRVLHEAVDIGLRRREAREVEACAPQERRGIGVGRGRETLRLKPREDERVGRRTRPVAIGGGGGLGRCERLVRPVVLAALRDVVGAPAVRGSRRVAGGGSALDARIRRAHRNPLLEERDVVVPQLARRRHLVVAVEVSHRADQKARVCVTGYDRRPRVAALQHAVAGVELQPALRLAARDRVAAVAVGDQDWPDLRLEELHLVGGERRRGGVGLHAAFHLVLLHLWNGESARRSGEGKPDRHRERESPELRREGRHRSKNG